MDVGANPYQHTFAGAAEPPRSRSAALDKPRILAGYAARYGVRTLVETGLYGGWGSGMGVPNVYYVAIDWQAANVEAAERHLGIERSFELHEGDSAVKLPFALSHDYLPRPVLFWLDAHALDAEERAPPCPLLAELAAIRAWQHAASSVVLVDDLWGMGVVAGWPTLDELRAAAAAGPWRSDETDGILRLTPREGRTS